ncbi:hypothetical protein F4781DRAFT_395971 [Annulohypoxylon bovei var. microspora]|nr:hypothetical protein F4781DRAFT_395971 [Annulohypoxylon bovei var. microspora]
MSTHLAARQRRALILLSAEWSTQQSRATRLALHYQGMRSTAALRAFLDAARAYDEELLFLSFQLSGPSAVRHIPALPTTTTTDANILTTAQSSLRRATPILASAAWRIKHLVDLWAAHTTRAPSGQQVWSHELGKAVDGGKLSAELACHRFWGRVAARFGPLVRAMEAEVECMRGVVAGIEECRELAFVRELDRGLGAGASMPSQASGPPLYLMAGALPVPAATKPSRLASLKAWAAKSAADNALGVDFSILALKARYQALKAHDAVRGTAGVRASLEAWVAFRQSLDGRPGAPSTETVLLAHKADTRILLARNQVQQLESGGGAVGKK